MPTVNIFIGQNSLSDKLSAHFGNLKSFIAEQLTCSEITLNANEVSVRVIQAVGGMIAALELEITAHAFAERVEKQDDICGAIGQYIHERIPELSDVRVWLILCDLGNN